MKKQYSKKRNFPRLNDVAGRKSELRDVDEEH